MLARYDLSDILSWMLLNSIRYEGSVMKVIVVQRVSQLSLVIADGHFDLPKGFVWVPISKHALSPAPKVLCGAPIFVLQC